MKLVERIIENKYREDNEGNVTCYTQEYEKYYYSNEKEKISHSILMQKNGFEDTGRQYDDLGTAETPRLFLVGTYVRYQNKNIINDLDIILKALSVVKNDEEYVEAEHDAVQMYCEEKNYIITEDEMKTIRAYGLEECFNNWVEYDNI